MSKRKTDSERLHDALEIIKAPDPRRIEGILRLVAAIRDFEAKTEIWQSAESLEAGAAADGDCEAAISELVSAAKVVCGRRYFKTLYQLVVRS